MIFLLHVKKNRKGISKVKNNKQPGLVLIHNEFIKLGSEILLLPLVKLFNRILNSGAFPEGWNVSSMSFLLKNNNVFYDCNNYRCLSLTSYLGKLFTSLLQSRLHNYMEDSDLYNTVQAGFRPGYRFTDHIFTIKTILNKYINECKKQVYACFVDFSKAFDIVWRSGLFKKILNLGIGGKLYYVLKYMYSNSRFVVRKHNTVSNAGISGQVVRHGDGLRPILFNVFVNDINEMCRVQSCSMAARENDSEPQ